MSSPPRRRELELNVQASMVPGANPPRPPYVPAGVGIRPAHSDIPCTYESHARDSARTGAPSHNPSLLLPSAFLLLISLLRRLSCTST